MTDPETKKKILARRARFLAAALASVGAAGAAAVGCSDDTDEPPNPFLSPDAGGDGRTDTGNTGDDADTAPVPCLSAPLDSSVPEDAAPEVCLTPLPPDTGSDGG